jgi:hypothetical protein
MGLIRTSCVFGAIVFALPVPDSMIHAGITDQPSPIMAAAKETFTDVKSFCAQQSDVCSSADYLAGRIQAKATYSMKLIFDWANEALATQHAVLPLDEAAADMIQTGSTAASVQLTISDLVAGWRGSIFPDKG